MRNPFKRAKDTSPLAGTKCYRNVFKHPPGLEVYHTRPGTRFIVQYEFHAKSKSFYMNTKHKLSECRRARDEWLVNEGLLNQSALVLKNL